MDDNKKGRSSLALPLTLIIEYGYVRRYQTPIFKSGGKAPLSINPEHTPGFRPGSRMG